VDARILGQLLLAADFLPPVWLPDDGQGKGGGTSPHVSHLAWRSEVESLTWYDRRIL
jgi:hypothetical protein